MEGGGGDESRITKKTFMGKERDYKPARGKRRKKKGACMFAHSAATQWWEKEKEGR